jgi:hypothetical protein
VSSSRFEPSPALVERAEREFATITKALQHTDSMWRIWSRAIDDLRSLSIEEDGPRLVFAWPTAEFVLLDDRIVQVTCNAFKSWTSVFSLDGRLLDRKIGPAPVDRG